MPCSKPIRRKYSKNEVILPSDRRGSMACHAVPRVMMYQGDACVPLEVEAILVRGLRWCRTEVWNNGCFVRLGRCGIVIWRLIAHYYNWAGMSGVRPPCCSALLFGASHVDPVAHEMTPTSFVKINNTPINAFHSSVQRTGTLLAPTGA